MATQTTAHRERTQWQSLEQWRKTAFLLGGIIFVADAALVAFNIAAGVEDPNLMLGQTFIGAAWTAAFIGLLGMYPSLADRSHWLARIGAIFAVLGAIVMAAMGAVFLGYFTGVLSGDPSSIAMYFLPGVFLGIVLGFGSFGVASLRTDIYSQWVGGLFLLLPLTFLFNIGSHIAGFSSLTSVLAVVCVLALTMLSLGNLFRTGNARAEHEEVEASGDASTG